MPAELITSLFSNVWTVALIVLFFCGSIFVHELGHFLAARRRGVKVTRFSIGFGPKIFGWTGKDGVDYRVSWIPLGGYVALPQLADMAAIEGEDLDTGPLPPVSYTSRMLVFVMGAVFNVLFALALATLVWIVGTPVQRDQTTTRIGMVVETVTTSEGEVVQSPAKAAGLLAGDVVTHLDGVPLNDWEDLLNILITSAGRTETGERFNTFTIDRDGETLDITVFPLIATDEKIRRVGIASVFTTVVADVTPDSIAAQAGLISGQRILNSRELFNALGSGQAGEFNLTIESDNHPVVVSLPLPAGLGPDVASGLAAVGLDLHRDVITVYPTPVEQFRDVFRMAFRTLSSLINPQSEIGLDKLSGPVGIIRVFHLAAEADIRLVLWFTILVNINLAIFNLLPIPVLDGGHMLFATIGKLRGRALPANFIMTTQSVFMMLLLTMIVYVSFFDIRRIFRNNAAPPPVQETREAEPAGE